LCLFPAVSWASPSELAPLSQTEDPSEPSLLEARKLLDKKKWSEAAVAFRLLLKNDSSSPSILTGLSTALTYSGKRAEALELLGQAVGRAHGSQRVMLIRRTRVLSKLFLTNDTFKIYQEGLNLMFAKKYRSAKDRFEKALSEESDNVEILTRLGQSLLLENAAENAVERLQAAKKLNPFEPEVRLWLGRAHHQRGALNEALPELRAALSDLPGSELPPVWLAETLSSLGQTSSAIRVLTNDTKTWPYHVLSLIMSARFRAQLAHTDSQILWAARKDLQLALSRLDQYMSPDALSHEGDLGLDLRRPIGETKAEIQKLLQQIQGRLDESPPHR